MKAYLVSYLTPESEEGIRTGEYIHNLITIFIDPTSDEAAKQEAIKFADKEAATVIEGWIVEEMAVYSSIAECDAVNFWSGSQTQIHYAPAGIPEDEEKDGW